MDLEDSVAATPTTRSPDTATGENSCGTLSETVSKGGGTFLRNHERRPCLPCSLTVVPSHCPDGPFCWCAPVGHLMTTDMVRDASGDEVRKASSMPY
jgi:hypothetical protein